LLLIFFVFIVYFIAGYKHNTILQQIAKVVQKTERSYNLLLYYSYGNTESRQVILYLTNRFHVARCCALKPSGTFAAGGKQGYVFIY